MLDQTIKFIGFDAGDKESGIVCYDPAANSLCSKEIIENNMLFDCFNKFSVKNHILALEMVACYGMPVGKNVFETVLWIGRAMQHWIEMKGKYILVYRKEYKMHFCQSMKAKDSNIRQALIDRFGGKGTKKDPGFFYEIKDDTWSASAIAIFVYDKYMDKKIKLRGSSLYELEIEEIKPKTNSIIPESGRNVADLF